MEDFKKTVNNLSEHFNTRMMAFQNDLKNLNPSASPSSNIAQQFDLFRSLVHGVAEEKKEDTSASVVKVLSDHLKVPGIISESISRSHRLGQPSADKPRAILIKFRDYGMKDKVWQAKKHLKGTGVTLSEFLTKGRHAVFQEARQRFGVSRCWTKDGIVMVLGSDQKRYRVSSKRDLDGIQSSSEETKASSSAAVVASVAKDTRPPLVRAKRIVKK